MNIPNLITIFRIFLTVPLVIFLIMRIYPVALLIFIVASLSDYLDGYLARKLGMVTDVGKVLDQIADKVLITSTLIVLMDLNLVGMWYVLGIVLRDMIVNATRTMCAYKGVIISADKLGKSKTVSQIVVIVYILSVASIFKGYPGVFGIILIWISFLLTILSGLNYVISGFRILKGE